MALSCPGGDPTGQSNSGPVARSNSDTYSNSDSHSNSDIYPNSDTHSNPNTYSNSDAHSNPTPPQLRRLLRRHGPQPPTRPHQPTRSSGLPSNSTTMVPSAIIRSCRAFKGMETLIPRA